MRICLVGKFPPIQGGVSMRTYWTAHALARRGHDVHVVTNANEATPPFRMYMRADDWTRCEADYGRGRVSVHGTDPVDRSQYYVPMASPFVSKLAALAARAHAERPFDVVFSYYMEPYGVAGHLAAEIAGVPHVVRMAGSDAGRLWLHPQFAALYDHVLRSATIVLAAGPVAERMVERGIDPARITSGGGFVVPEELFRPEGPTLDITLLTREVQADADLRNMVWGGFAADRPYFGVYGKLGESKGSFALLEALGRLKRAGLESGLVALAHGRPLLERRFRSRAQELGLEELILQLPFLPHWRVPEFLRGCLAVCCLEQDFPIGFHSPIVPREVLLVGACLVASTEILGKLPFADKVVHGYNAVAVNDVNDVEELSGKLAAIVERPELVPVVGARAHRLAQQYQRDIEFPGDLETALAEAAALGRSPAGGGSRHASRRRRKSATRPAAPTPSAVSNHMFRLASTAWALAPEDLRSLAPAPATTFRIAPLASRSRAVRKRPNVAEALIDARAAEILRLCDGTRTVAEIAALTAAHRRAVPTQLDRVAGCVLRHLELGVLRLGPPAQARPTASPTPRRSRQPN